MQQNSIKSIIDKRLLSLKNLEAECNVPNGDRYAAFYTPNGWTLKTGQHENAQVLRGLEHDDLVERLDNRMDELKTVDA